MSGPGESERTPIDPRHDAIYQRGYQPGQSAPATARRSLTVPPAAVAPVDTGRPAGEVSDGIRDFDSLVMDSEGFQDELPRSGFNPFIVILWVIAVLFIGASGTLQWRALTGSYSFSYSGTGPMPIDMVIQQLSYTISPSILTIGLITIAGLLFWHAHTWRARRLGRSEL